MDTKYALKPASSPNMRLLAVFLTFTLLLCQMTSKFLIAQENLPLTVKAGDQVRILDGRGYKVRRTAEIADNIVGYAAQGEYYRIEEITEGGAFNVFGQANTVWYQIIYEGTKAYLCQDPDPSRQEIKSSETPSSTSAQEVTTTITANTNTSTTPATTPDTPSTTSTSVTASPVQGAYTAAKWQQVLATFPASYHSYLNALHSKYPSWRFEAAAMDYTLEYAINLELRDPSANLVPYNFTAYRDMNNTRMYDAGGWYTVNRQALSFFMDPRNWLTEKYIFMFEKLSEVTASPARKRLQYMFQGNNDLLQMIPDIVSAANELQVSPAFVGSRIKNEVSTYRDNVLTITRSANGTLKVPSSTLELLGFSADNTKPYYNVFNIGAYQGSSPQTNAVLYAMGYGSSESRKQELLLPWDSMYKAIYGGIKFIAEDYLSAKQNTNYFMKFNLQHPYSQLAGKIWHQYMGAATAPATEAEVNYAANVRAEVMDDSFTFLIPVYQSLPATPYTNPGTRYSDATKVTVPTKDDEANNNQIISKPETYAVEGDIISPSSGAFYVRSAATTQSSALTMADPGEELTVLGRVTGEQPEGYTNQWYKVRFGSTVGYMIAYPAGQSIVRKAQPKPTTTQPTSQTTSSVTAKPTTKTTTKPSTKTTTKATTGTNARPGTQQTTTPTTTKVQSLLGDVDNDGRITLGDILFIRYDILNIKKLSSEQRKRADLDKDGKITLADLLPLRYHILNLKKLSWVND